MLIWAFNSLLKEKQSHKPLAKRQRETTLHVKLVTESKTAQDTWNVIPSFERVRKGM